MNAKKLTIICGTFILAGVLFWPTLYHYDKMTLNGMSFPVRIHRLTGYTEYFVMGTWTPQTGQTNKDSHVFPSDKQAKVTGKGGVAYDRFSGEIYNGSNWKITSMIVKVVVKEKDGSVRWARKFKTDVTIKSLSTEHISFSLMDAEDISSLLWDIAEIRGHPGS